MEAGSETTVLTEGDGDAVADGDEVIAHIWIGNGFTESESFSTYDPRRRRPSPSTTASPRASATASRASRSAPASRPSRWPTRSSATAATPSLEIGNKDTVVVIVDLLDTAEVLEKPQGKAQEAPAWAPEVLTDDDDAVTGLDFADAPKPNGRLLGADLVVGDGARVEKGQTITVNYLGQVYGGDEPFDESFSKSPASFGIGTGQVIKGWDKALVGKTVGSRVVLAIPPASGYGEAGKPSAGIKGTDTLYFVVDILAAS